MKNSIKVLLALVVSIVICSCMASTESTTSLVAIESTENSVVEAMSMDEVIGQVNADRANKAQKSSSMSPWWFLLEYKVFVSNSGDDANSGKNPKNALRSFTEALQRIKNLGDSKPFAAGIIVVGKGPFNSYRLLLIDRLTQITVDSPGATVITTMPWADKVRIMPDSVPTNRWEKGFGFVTERGSILIIDNLLIRDLDLGLRAESGSDIGIINSQIGFHGHKVYEETYETRPAGIIYTSGPGGVWVVDNTIEVFANRNHGYRAPVDINGDPAGRSIVRGNTFRLPDTLETLEWSQGSYHNPVMVCIHAQGMNVSITDNDFISDGGPSSLMVLGISIVDSTRGTGFTLSGNRFDSFAGIPLVLNTGGPSEEYPAAGLDVSISGPDWWPF